MLSYGLLHQALSSDTLTPQRIFDFSISSAASGLISHRAYVSAAEIVSRRPPADRVMEENVTYLVGADVNPVMHLLLAADSEKEFTRRWNRYNEIAGLGVRTVLRSNVERDFERYPQGELSDSMLRCKLMTRFIEELHSRCGERRYSRQAKHLSETAKRLDVSESPAGAVVSVLEEFPHANLQQCSKRMGCSERTLQRHLSGGAAKFAQIRNAARITIAANLIVTSGEPLSEIAVDAGFYDAPHFNKAIKRSMGITPRQFKSLITIRDRPGPTSAFRRGRPA